MKIRHLLLATTFAGFALACGGDTTAMLEEASEKSDALTLCDAIIYADIDDSSTDAAVAGALVTSDWGKQMQSDLQVGEDGPSAEVQAAMIAKMKEIGVSTQGECDDLIEYWEI